MDRIFSLIEKRSGRTPIASRLIALTAELFTGKFTTLYFSGSSHQKA